MLFEPGMRTVPVICAIGCKSRNVVMARTFTAGPGAGAARRSSGVVLALLEPAVARIAGIVEQRLEPDPVIRCEHPVHVVEPIPEARDFPVQGVAVGERDVAP